MEKIDEVVLNGISIKYYFGFNLDEIRNHSKSGDDGMMIVFVSSVKNEKIKYQRNKIINDILESQNNLDFYEILDSIDNPYISIYETHGYNDVFYKSIKNKMELIRDFDFKISETIWNVTNI